MGTSMKQNNWALGNFLRMSLSVADKERRKTINKSVHWKTCTSHDVDKDETQSNKHLRKCRLKLLESLSHMFLDHNICTVLRWVPRAWRWVCGYPMMEPASKFPSGLGRNSPKMHLQHAMNQFLKFLVLWRSHQLLILRYYRREPTECSVYKSQRVQKWVHIPYLKLSLPESPRPFERLVRRMAFHYHHDKRLLYLVKKNMLHKN